MTFVFFAEGFEEIEALTVVDILRRIGRKVTTVGVGGRTIRGAHGIPVICDAQEEDVSPDDLEMVVIPGGMPGVSNLEKSPVVKKFIQAAEEQGAYLAAICAGPSLLGKMGLLQGKKAVCYPGFEQELTGAILTGEFVQQDGRIITAKGPGVSMEFALRLAELLSSDTGSQAVKNFEEMKAALQCRS